jgi:hypothetical protein
MFQYILIKHGAPNYPENPKAQAFGMDEPIYTMLLAICI